MSLSAVPSESTESVYVVPEQVEVPRTFLDRLRAIGEATSDDPTRFTMQGVLIEVLADASLKLTATNGHILANNTLTGDSVEPLAALIRHKGKPSAAGYPSLFVDADNLERIPAILKQFSRLTPGFMLDVTGTKSGVTLSINGLGLNLVQSDYPNYSSVYPKGFKRPVQVGLNAELLLQLAKAIGGKDTSKGSPHSVVLTFESGSGAWGEEQPGSYLGPIVVHKDGGHSGLIMPMRV